MYQPSRSAYVPGMEHFMQPPRRSWVLRHKALTATGIAVLVIAFVAIGEALLVKAARPDYRDQIQLSEAVKEHYKAETAGCSKKPDGTYFCIVVSPAGAGASYTVTVSPDGHSWSAS